LIHAFVATAFVALPAAAPVMTNLPVSPVVVDRRQLLPIAGLILADPNIAGAAQGQRGGAANAVLLQLEIRVAGAAPGVAYGDGPGPIAEVGGSGRTRRTIGRELQWVRV